jgi:hypothetical protein
MIWAFSQHSFATAHVRLARVHARPSVWKAQRLLLSMIQSSCQNRSKTDAEQLISRRRYANPFPRDRTMVCTIHRPRTKAETCNPQSARPTLTLNNAPHKMPQKPDVDARLGPAPLPRCSHAPGPRPAHGIGSNRTQKKTG